MIKYYLVGHPLEGKPNDKDIGSNLVPLSTIKPSIVCAIACCKAFNRQSDDQLRNTPLYQLRAFFNTMLIYRTEYECFGKCLPDDIETYR